MLQEVPAVDFAAVGGYEELVVDEGEPDDAVLLTIGASGHMDLAGNAPILVVLSRKRHHHPG